RCVSSRLRQRVLDGACNRGWRNIDPAAVTGDDIGDVHIHEACGNICLDAPLVTDRSHLDNLDLVAGLQDSPKLVVIEIPRDLPYAGRIRRDVPELVEPVAESGNMEEIALVVIKHPRSGLCLECHGSALLLAGCDCSGVVDGALNDTSGVDQSCATGHAVCDQMRLAFA